MSQPTHTPTQTYLDEYYQETMHNDLDGWEDQIELHGLEVVKAAIMMACNQPDVPTAVIPNTLANLVGYDVLVGWYALEGATPHKKGGVKQSVYLSHDRKKGVLSAYIVTYSRRTPGLEVALRKVDLCELGADDEFEYDGDGIYTITQG